MKYTEDYMAHVLVNYHFNPRTSICVPNVSWGFMPWEADLLVASASRRLTEVEIKISWSDLKADGKKRKHRNYFSQSGNRIDRFFYAVPSEVWSKHGAEAVELLPTYAGVITVGTDEQGCFVINTARAAERNTQALRLTNAQYFKLMRLGVMRYWTRQTGRFEAQT